jgi:hypothetical protein
LVVSGFIVIATIGLVAGLRETSRSAAQDEFRILQWFVPLASLAPVLVILWVAAWRRWQGKLLGILLSGQFVVMTVPLALIPIGQLLQGSPD